MAATTESLEPIGVIERAHDKDCAPVPPSGHDESMAEMKCETFCFVEVIEVIIELTFHVCHSAD